jgi:membrane protein DedA with SNARE-associated domain
VGKPFIWKYGKYFLIRHEKYLEAEALFSKNDRLYTFLGRFIPVIRHLISIPAGIFRMRYDVFAALTVLGATIWCAFLVWLGYAFGEGVLDAVQKYSHEAEIVAIVALLGFMAWFIFHKTKKRKGER